MMKQAQNAGKRLAWIDWCRAFAICSVLLCYTTERVYSLNLPQFADYSILRQVFSLSLFTVGRLGVPIFFFMSGYLLLDRAYDFESTKRFYRRNLVGLVLTTEIWIVIYNLFNAYFYGRTINVDVLIRNMLFLEPTQMSHMWYMPVIIGIYFFLPFAANAVQHMDDKILGRMMLFAFVCLFIIPEVNVLLSAKRLTTMKFLIDLSYSGGCYGIYVITGYFWKRGTLIRFAQVFFPGS